MFGDTIKKLRKKKGLSQEKFGDMFGVSQQAVWKWEAGINEPDSKTLSQMADCFGVSVDYIMGRNKQSEKDKRRAELYAQAKASDDPVLKGLINAIDKLLGLDE